MSSVIDIVHQLKLRLNLSTTEYEQDYAIGWDIGLAFAARLVAYLVLLGVMVVFLLWILKCLSNFDCENDGEEIIRATERNPLWPRRLRNKATSLFTSYGTCERDPESETCSSSSSRNHCISEELYDGKICVICYDEERNSFFVPCGHSATCYDCAQRLLCGDTKTCPICRRLIGKVRKWFFS